MDLSATGSSATVAVAQTRQVLELLPAGALSAAADLRRRALRSRADRDDFVAARLLAARVLEAAGVGPVAPASLGQRCDVCGGPHGRPLPVAGLHVSWSHARGWVAAAASPAAVGVDVEGVADTVAGDAGLPLEALTPAERAIAASAADPARAFRLAWVAKEACVKAGAVRLDDFGDLEVLAGPDRLVASSGALLLSARRVCGAMAAAASASPAAWHALGDGGRLVPLPGTGRGVGTPA